MNNLTRICFTTISALILCGNTANAKDGRDLSTGIAYPSDNSALYENGAVLKESASHVEILLGTDNTDLLGSWVGSTSGIGVGLGAQIVNDDVGLLGGLGVGLGSLAIGLDALWIPDANRFSIDAGMLLPMSVFRFALVVTDITDGIGSIIGGLGIQASNAIRLEGDLEYDTNSESWTLLPALAVQVQKLSLMAGLSIPLSDNGGNTDFRFGVSFWVTGNLMLEYLHQVVLGDHTIGVKFSL